MITKRPSRILNEHSTFLGLTIIDFAGVGYFLILTHTVLSKISLELLSFFITGILVFFLIGIRSKYRPKTIRDYLAHALTKQIHFKNGEIL